MLPITPGAWIISAEADGDEMEFIRRVEVSSPTFAEVMDSLTRRVDVEWRESSNESDTLGRGVVEFGLNTGGGFLGSSMEAGFIVNVYTGDRHYQRQILSCRSAGSGEPPPTRNRATAFCDGRTIELALDANTLVVRDDGAPIVSLTVPEGTTLAFVP